MNSSSLMKKEKYKKELEMLNDKLTIIKSLPDSIVKKYNYDFNKIINKIELLVNNTSGKVYKFHSNGYLETDGYEKGYLFLFSGSSVLFHSHQSNVKEHYKLVESDGSERHINFCDIGLYHEIEEVKENTLIRTYKYIPKSFIKKC